MIANTKPEEGRPKDWRPNAGQFIRVNPWGNLSEVHLGIVEEVYSKSAKVKLKSPKSNTTLMESSPIPFEVMEPVTLDEAREIGNWLIGNTSNTEIAIAAYQAQMMEAAEGRNRLAS